MTSHLRLDALAYLVGSDGPPSADDHLAGCDICRDRLANLRARSAEVSSALSGIDGLGTAFADVETMPDDVTLRITAALAAGRGVAGVDRGEPGDDRGVPTAGSDAADTDRAARPGDSDTADGQHTDELAGARARRSHRLRGWLSAAAVIVVVGGGFGAIAHVVGGRSAGNSTAASNAGGAASRDESLSAQGDVPATAAPTGTATTGPGAARGALRKRHFVDDAEAFVAAQNLVKPSRQASEPLTGSASGRCATVARGEASSTAGYKAGGGNAAPAAFVGAVTVDGHQGVLYLVDVGAVRVAVAMAGCATSNPDVLASATL